MNNPTRLNAETTGMSVMVNEIKKPVLLTLVLLIICGLAYPVLMTGLSQAIFPEKANGSLIEVNGHAVGSKLVGQAFTDARFMKCRPSAYNYNTYTQADKDSGSYAGVASGSQNFGPTNPALAERVEKDLEEFLRNSPSVSKEDIPTDLLTASGSGLEPYISPAAAAVQIPAMAEATGLSKERLESIVKRHTRGKFLGIFGGETVNVLMVNLDIAGELGLLQASR